MEKSKQQKLFKKYKKIFRQHVLPPSQTAMCWGLEVGDGWYDLIDNLCADIQGYLDLEKAEQIEATQVKQKFGGLRFYYQPYNKVVDILIREASNYSMRTCELCGETKGVKHTEKGWITPLCKKCMEGVKK